MNFPGYPLGTTKPLMSPEGRGTSGVMAWGESLGEWEERDQLPFRPYAEAGSVLERALWRAGVSRDSLTLTNLVWYRPPGNALEGTAWEMDAIRACKPFNDDLVAEVQPKCLLALGGLAFRELTGMSGTKEGITLCRGFVVPGFAYPGIPVVGTYHPSYLRRGSKERQKSEPRAKVEAAGGGTQGMALLGVLIRDIQLALTIAAKGAPDFQHGLYQLGATLDNWRNFESDCRAHPELPISYDWETPTSAKVLSEEEIEAGAPERDILQGQMSLRPGEAIVSQFTPDLLAIWRRILALPNPKLDWNGRKFDRPLAIAYGMPLAGPLHDLMDMWHHAQPDLPRGLQYATSFFCPEVGPWKHMMGQDPLWYGALDVDMPQRIYAALRKSLGLFREPHSGVTLLRGYQEQVVRLAPVLDRMSARGMPVDEPKRQALDETFTATLAEIDTKMQGLAPEELRPVEPKEGYKRATKIPKACLEASGQTKLFAEVPASGSQDVRDDGDGLSATRAIHSPEASGQANLFGSPTGLDEESDRPGLGSPPELRGNDGTRVVDATGAVYVTRTFRDATPKRAHGHSRTQQDAGTSRGGCPQDPGAPVIQTRVLDEAGAVYVTRTFQDAKSKLPVQRWAKLCDFTPSPKQVLAYLRWKGYKIPRNVKTSRETTDELGLRRLIREHPEDGLLPLVLDHREVEKARSTYVEGWKPGLGGRVHSTFGFKPATGQLSSENPNLQNFPAHTRLAQAMKQMLVARPGHVLVNLDYKSFHILTLGFEAQDPAWMRMARLDMHSFFCLAGLLRLEPPEKILELPDAELGAKLTWYRKQPKVYPEYACQDSPGGMTFAQIRNKKAKPAILGTQFGQAGPGLFRRNSESFASIQDAKDCVDMINRIFPRPASWRTEIRLRGDRDTCLISRHGYVRRFWDVFARKFVADNFQPRRGQIVLDSPKGRILLGPGDDHESCIAYLPSNDAFGTIRGTMVRLAESGATETYGLVNQIHDSLVFECPKDKLEDCVQTVKLEMERPNPLLVDVKVAPGGLSCQVEVAFGENLGEMQAFGC